MLNSQSQSQSQRQSQFVSCFAQPLSLQVPNSPPSHRFTCVWPAVIMGNGPPQPARQALGAAPGNRRSPGPYNGAYQFDRQPPPPPPPAAQIPVAQVVITAPPGLAAHGDQRLAAHVDQHQGRAALPGIPEGVPVHPMTPSASAGDLAVPSAPPAVVDLVTPMATQALTPAPPPPPGHVGLFQVHEYQDANFDCRLMAA